jgi:hypothetical protein
MLEQKVREKGLSDHVFFHNRYVTLEKLLEFILASDAYVTPYLEVRQITSGTLAYACGSGKAVVSTPYWHAEELLADGRGVLVPFRDPQALARAFTELLGDEVRRNQMRKRADQYGRSMIWREVGRRYIELFREAIERRAELRLPTPKAVMPRPPAPEVRLDHVRRLTDDAGVLASAAFATPDRRGGYRTGDNALALVAAVDTWRMLKEEDLFPLVHRYLAFVNHAVEPEGVRGRLSFDRRWEDEGSELACGYCIWAAGHVVGHAPTDAVLGLAARLSDALLPRSEGFESAQAMALALIGIHRYLIRFSGASELRRLRETLAGRLHGLFDAGTDDWPWHADRLERASGHAPHALLLSGRWLERGEMVDRGLRLLDWLFGVQSDPETQWLSPAGDLGGMRRGKPKPRYVQRPVEPASLAGACEEAFLITRDDLWARRLDLCLSWFLGWNDRRESLYDFRTFGVSDGIEEAGLSRNQGAEAALSYLMTLHAVHRVEEAKATSAPPAGAPPSGGTPPPGADGGSVA